MAEYISFQPSDYFNSVLYTGTGAVQTISGVGFEPDLTWCKDRTNSYDQVWFDQVRGATERLTSNTYTAESTQVNDLTAWNSDGFVVGSGSNINNNTNLFVGWNWKAGTTTGLSGGTMTPVAYSINTTSGFGIYQYVGTAATATIAHGLGKVPKFVITKSMDAGNNWRCYHEAMGNTKLNQLNENANIGTDANAWNSTTPTDTLFTLGSSNDTNTSGVNYIAYMFCDVPGYSKLGEYWGNGQTSDGTFVYTGFRPSFILMKRTSGGTGNWQVFDDKRLGYNGGNSYLAPNDANAENTGGQIDIVSNGFKMRNSGTYTNASGDTYLYAAFAEFPLVSSNDVPTVAR